MSPLIVAATSSLPTARPMSWMSASVVSTSGANRTSTGTPSWRSCAMASGGLKLSPPAITRSGSRLTIFSTSTEPNFATSGMSFAAAGYGVKSSTLPLIRSPTPSANRVSVAAGGRGTIVSGSSLTVARAGSSSWGVTGEGGGGGGAAGRVGGGGAGGGGG